MATPAAAREFKVRILKSGWNTASALLSILSFPVQKCIQPEEHFRQHVENGVRPDGREDLCALRPVSISAGTIGTADGSAVVKQENAPFKFQRIFALHPPHASGLATDALRNLNIVLKREFEMPLGRYRGRVWNQVGAGASETRGACER